MATRPGGIRGRRSSALAGLAFVLVAAACGGSTGPGPGGGGVTFDLGSESFAAAGDVVFDIEGRPDPGRDWAVAADPDSVGGVVVTAFRASSTEGVGDLFVLQLQPAHTGAFSPCGPDEPCRGRLFRGWNVNLSTYDGWFEITSGTVDVQTLSDTRVRGTFTFTVRSDGGSGDQAVAIQHGVFDVPVDGRLGGYVCGLPPSSGCTQ
jgi:hypothetical protein